MEGLQPGSFRFGASRPDNVAVVEERENVRLKEEKKKRLSKKPRVRRRRLMLQDTLAQTVLMWSDHVSVSLMVTPKYFQRVYNPALGIAFTWCVFLLQSPVYKLIAM